MVPDGILCSKSHEWVLENEDNALIGLTDWAVNELGDIVFVELPEVGTNFVKDETFATIESVKAASEIYMPVGGEVVEVNEKLIKSPELINEDSFENWLIKIKPSNFKDESQTLMDYTDYIEEAE